MRIFSASSVIPISSPPIHQGAIAVEAGRIADVGPVERLRALYNAPISEFTGCAIIPGLINAHTHLELTHFPSWKLRKGVDYSPRTYVDWILQVIKIKRALQPGEMEQSLREGLRISLEAGTVAVGDVLTDRTLLPSYAQCPAKSVVFLEAIGQDPVMYAGLKEQLATVLAGRLLPFGLSPHAPHTVAPLFFQEIKKLADEFAVPTMTHLSESAEEAQFMHDSTGPISEVLYPHIRWDQYVPPPRRTTSTAFLGALGVLDEKTIAVHCVHLTPDDARILAQKGVRVVICPRSNETLAVGKPPLRLLKKLRIPIALGTDSLASNDSLSLWDEMRFILKKYPDIFSPEEVLRMATREGACALGIDRDFGTLETGRRADFLIVGIDGSVRAPDLPRVIIEEGVLHEVYISGKQI